MSFPTPVPFATVPAALDAVRSGGVDGVMVPIENSVEGGVSSTLDALNAGAGAPTESQLLLVGEVLNTDDRHIGKAGDASSCDTRCAAGDDIIGINGDRHEEAVFGDDRLIAGAEIDMADQAEQLIGAVAAHDIGGVQTMHAGNCFA